MARWWFPFDGMEQIAFKPVPGGFVYRAPNPWLIGRGRFYIVNAAQKSELAGIHRTVMLISFAAIVVIAAIGAPLLLDRVPDQPYAVFGLSLLLGLAIGLAVNGLLVHKVSPIVARLTPTDQRITQRDAFKIQTTALSRRFIIVFAALSFALFVLSALRPLLDPAGRDLYAVVGVLLFGAATIYWIVLLIAKGRQTGP